jgi:thioredoxin-like negative regulator of GroEL
MENYSDAAVAFKQALKVRPKHAEARYQLGICYVLLGKQFIKSAQKEQSALKKLDSDLAKDLMKKIKGK